MPDSAYIEVQYRQGIYLPELDLWLDPHRGKDRAFISHAHSDHFARHQLAICSSVTARLIAERYGTLAEEKSIIRAYREPFEFSGFVLTLLPAGHIFGSAMLHIRRISDDATLLYTGDFKLRQGRSAEPAELMTADTLIMETTFGLPHFCFPPQEEVIANILKFVRETLDDGGIPVLLGYSLGKAQEILSSLSGAGVPVMLHNSMLKLTEAYQEYGHTFPAYEKFVADQAAGHVVILPPSAAKSQAVRQLKVCRTAMLSGWALTPGAKYRYQVDEVFPLSDHADYPELLECVAHTKPKRVLTVHGSTSEFAQDLRERGHDARSLITDDQLEFSLPKNRTAPVVNTTPIPASTHTLNSFGAWAATCELVAAESSRLKKQGYLAVFLQSLSKDHLATATRWFAGLLSDPATGTAPLNVGWALIRRSLLEMSALREHEYRAISRSQNDTGRTAYLVLQQAENSSRLTAFSHDLSISDIAQGLVKLRDAHGPQGKNSVLKAMLEKLSPLEGSYLVRLLTGELRVGSKEGLIEEAVALAFKKNAEAVREAAMLTGDIGQAALLAAVNQLQSAAPIPFVPIKVMLASPAESAEVIWDRLAGDPSSANSVWLEDKYDGIRAQLHFSEERAEIYTRDLKCVTAQFPEITAAAFGLKEEVILDGEIIAHAENKKLTFFDLQKRLGRRDQADLFISSDITVRYVVFDMLWKEGRSLLGEPLVQRRSELEKLVLPILFQCISVHQVCNATEVEAAFHQARRSGNEGLIAKDSASVYTPGRRGKTWLKLKKAFSTLDTVVVKAEQGHGKRSHMLSDYTFAVRDELTGELKTIGKAYSGLTDREIEELTDHFQIHTVSQRGNVRTVTPNIVLEIAFDSIQTSTRHESGLAMRFPRIKAIRRDKDVTEIDSLGYARQLAGLSSTPA